MFPFTYHNVLIKNSSMTKYNLQRKGNKEVDVNKENGWILPFDKSKKRWPCSIFWGKNKILAEEKNPAIDACLSFYVILGRSSRVSRGIMSFLLKRCLIRSVKELRSNYTLPYNILE